MTAAPHGGDAAAVARRVGVPLSSLVDLSASLNPAAPDMAAALHDALEAVGRYPDVTEASALLAAAIGIDPARLVLTNGGAEAIALVAQVEPSGLVVEPEFSLYRRHLDVAAVGRDVAPGGPSARWRSNPSSPLGALAADDEVARVWDEAFYPLATGTWTRGDDASWRLGSLTKLWACPGVRLGYVIAPDDELADAVRRRQPRWSVNGIAAAIVEPMLARTDLAVWQRRIAASRRGFVAALADLGFDVATTDANWVLVRRPGLRDELIAERVVVRDCASFGLPGLHRVALPADRLREPVLAAFGRVAARS